MTGRHERQPGDGNSDFVAWQQQLLQDLPPGEWPGGQAASETLALEQTAARATSTELLTDFARLGVTPATTMFDTLPRPDGYLHVMFSPAPQFKGWDPKDPLYRLTLNLVDTNHDGRLGTRIKIDDYILSPSSHSLTVRSDTVYYPLGAETITQPPSSPPLVFRDEQTGGFRLYPSEGYKLFPPLPASLSGSLPQLRCYNQVITKLRQDLIFTQLQLSVNQDSPTPDVSHKPKDEM